MRRGISEERGTYHSKKERRLKFGIKERVRTGLARAYLIAIEKQYKIDAEYQSDQTSLDIGNPESALYDHNTILRLVGKLMFTYDIQMMIRELIRQHDIARPFDSENIIMAHETPAQERAEVEHARLCRDLMATMSEFVGEDMTGGREVA
jgi:hypothetical protein